MLYVLQVEKLVVTDKNVTRFGDQMLWLWPYLLRDLKILSFFMRKNALFAAKNFILEILEGARVLGVEFSAAA